MNQLFKQLWEQLSQDINRNAVEKGFYSSESDFNDGEKIALMHSELSECLESIRHGDPASDHIPEFKGSEEELADCIIRIMDYAEYKGLRLFDAVIAKHEFNKGREYKHGGKRF